MIILMRYARTLFINAEIKFEIQGGFMDNKNSVEVIDEMKSLKDNFKVISIENVEDTLKHLSDEQKDILLRLYIYEYR